MSTLSVFPFNPFQENTFVLSDPTGECVIIDPGCYSPEEKKELGEFIRTGNLRPVRLLHTHCHIDHMLGNRFVFEMFGLKPWLHKQELPLLTAASDYGAMWGIHADKSPEPEGFLKEDDVITFGHTELHVLFTPGHSPGGICLYNKKEKYVIAGDVLFNGSIGRTDLPGGNYATLIESIKTRLFSLGDDVRVFSGHGPETTIGHEKKHNPFLG